MYIVINQETKIFMAEFGSYGSELDKYKKMGIEDDETIEASNTGREELIESASTAFEEARGNLSAELQETFQGAIESADTYYDLDPTLASEILETASSILEQLAHLSDEDEVEERLIEVEPEIEGLTKMSARLSKKGVH